MHKSLDEGAARAARFSAAFIDSGMQGEIGAGLAGSIDIVAQRAAAAIQCIIERSANGLNQSRTALQRYPAGAGFRVNARPKQAF